MNLQNILREFNATLNEEQAWALCHQYAKHFVCDNDRGKRAKGYAIACDLESIVISEDGEISIAGDKLAKNERELVESFGRVLFQALEFGLDQNVEKPLTPDIERLIERMTLSYDGIISEEDDEGYEDYEEEHHSLDHGPCTWKVVVKMCEEHLEQPVKANEHYLAVCRALITEAADLKSFLEKVSSTGESLKNFTNVNNNGGNQGESQSEDFPNLNFTEWAHLWIQVVGDLRYEVKLKKVEGYTRNVEFELTPYEILMEDIRQRNYSLKKVAADGEAPLLREAPTRDAHDVILDFIRSRPTLKPIENRKLRPRPPRPKSMHELLLEQIQESPPVLRHVETPKEPILLKTRDASYEKQGPITASRSYDDILNVKPERRRLPAPPFAAELGVNISTSSLIETDSDEGGDCSSSFAVDSVRTDELSTFAKVNKDATISTGKRKGNLRSSPLSGTFGCTGEQDSSTVRRRETFGKNLFAVRQKKVLSVELPPSPVLRAAPDSFGDTSPLSGGARFAKHMERSGVRRAHSMAVRATDPSNGPIASATQRRLTWREQRALAAQKSPGVDLLPPRSIPPPPSPSCFNSPLAKRDRKEREHLRGRSNGVQRTMSDKRAFAPPQIQNCRDQCVKVTTKELIVLREKLIAQDLEKYQGRGEFYSNLRKGKICFNCRVREFSIFWWARTCEICKQKICSKCMKKVQAPADDSLQAPVYDLWPDLGPEAFANRPSFLPENSPTSNLRFPFDSRLSVHRECNGDEPSASVARKNQSPKIKGVKHRKMDVCEACRDLISRALYLTTMRPRRALAEANTPDQSRYVFGRPSAVADKLKRSVSSAGFTPLQKSASRGQRRENAGVSRSVERVRAAITQ